MKLKLWLRHRNNVQKDELAAHPTIVWHEAVHSTLLKCETDPAYVSEVRAE